jgi:nicotinamidase-related amidase
VLASKHHPHLLRPEQTHLVVIDMQEPFLKSVVGSEHVQQRVCALIRGATVLRLPIISTMQNQEKLGDVVPQVKQLLPPLLPPFDKMTFSCLANPAFASELHRSGRKQILLCGIEAHICVCQTALELISAGYQVHVAADAVSSRTEEDRRIGLEKMRQSGVLVSSVEAALFEMLGEAGTPDFREILKIVK